MSIIRFLYVPKGVVPTSFTEVIKQVGRGQVEFVRHAPTCIADGSEDVYAVTDKNEFVKVIAHELDFPTLTDVEGKPHEH